LNTLLLLNPNIAKISCESRRFGFRRSDSCATSLFEKYADPVLPWLELVISEPANLSALGALFESQQFYI